MNKHDTDINPALIKSFESGSEIYFIYKTAASALLESVQKKTELLRIFLNVSGNMTFAEKNFNISQVLHYFFTVRLAQDRGSSIFLVRFNYSICLLFILR